MLAGSLGSADAARIAALFRALADSRPYMQFLHVAKPENASQTGLERTFHELGISEHPLVFRFGPDDYVGFRGGLEHMDRLEANIGRWLSASQRIAGGKSH
jgi:hypothetical protein